jgi:hypothetical protein
MKNFDFASLTVFNLGNLSQKVKPLSKSGQMIPIESARYESIKSEMAIACWPQFGRDESIYCCVHFRDVKWLDLIS